MAVIPLELHGVSQWVGCIAGVLAGLIVQGEAQTFFVHLFQQLSQRTKINWDVNPAHHLDLLALPVLLLAGWGWTKKRVGEPSYFPTAPIYGSMIPLSGPLANLLLVGIIGTFHMFLPFTIFEVAIAINVQMALANLFIPIPPLALGRALIRPFGPLRAVQPVVELCGSGLLIAMLLAEHYLHQPFLSPWLSSMTESVLKWVLH